MDNSKKFKVGIEMPPLPSIEGETELSLFDPQNPDLGLFNILDEEQIRLSGSKLLYYKYYIDRDYDEVYLEDRSKRIATDPIQVKINNYADLYAKIFKTIHNHEYLAKLDTGLKKDIATSFFIQLNR